MEEVYEFSSGFPRQINIICDLAMFFASQVSQRTISRKIVNQCRERISFTVDETMAETENNIRAPAPTVRYRPIAKQRWPWLTAGRVVAALFLLLLLATGVALAPEPFKINTVQWLHKTYRSIFPSDEQPSRNIATPSDAAAPAADKVAFTDASKTVPAVLPPLRLPRRPPQVHFKKATPDPIDPSGAASPSPPEQSDRVPADLATGEQPDPGDAIDWLLNKRRQESRP